MRLPRDISGVDLAKLLGKYGYQVIRQTGSHIRLTTNYHGEHQITIPRHKDLRVGTLQAILSDVANHLGFDRTEFIEALFEK